MAARAAIRATKAYANRLDRAKLDPATHAIKRGSEEVPPTAAALAERARAYAGYDHLRHGILGEPLPGRGVR
jgi:hypothetical protein